VTREFAVDEKADQATGRIKEAAGSLAGDEDLKAEGKADRLSGELIYTVEDALHKK